MISSLIQDPWEQTESSNGSSESVVTGSSDSQSVDSMAEVTWYPLLGQSDDMAFFIDQSGGEKESLLIDRVPVALISSGFNLLHTPYSIYKAFEAAGSQGMP